jgi:membrane-associated protease RseP (regulator of RpoE activity)
MPDNRGGQQLNGYIIAILALIAYLGILLVGWRIKLWNRLGIKLYGPIMMLRTSRGRVFIERLSNHTRGWSHYGFASVVICAFMTAAVAAFLVWDVSMTLSAPSEIDLSDDLPYGQIGVNPAVTLTYAVIGLVVAVVAHELFHGILSSVGKIKLRSIGLLLLVVPIGAFVEPDEDALKATKRTNRLKVYASGPATNAILAALFLAILLGLLMPSVRPVADGTIVTSVAPDSPADISGIRAWSDITELNGESVNTTMFRSIWFANPGELVSINLTYKQQSHIIALPGGVVIISVSDGPAFNAGIRPGMIVTSLNDTVIHSVEQFESVVETSTRDAPVNITVMKLGYDTTGGVNWFVQDPTIRSVNMTTKWLYYRLHFPNQNMEEYRNVSIMGVTSSPLGIRVEDPDTILKPVAHPFNASSGVESAMRDSLRYLGLPFFGYAPIMSPAADLFEPTGILSPLPTSVFWLVSNLCYWIFWMNLMLALTNAIPVVPMDGGMVTSDLIKGLVRRLGERLSGFDLMIGRKPISDSQVDWLMIALTAVFAAMIAYLAVWQLLL